MAYNRKAWRTRDSGGHDGFDGGTVVAKLLIGFLQVKLVPVPEFKYLEIGVLEMLRSARPKHG